MAKLFATIASSVLVLTSSFGSHKHPANTLHNLVRRNEGKVAVSSSPAVRQSCRHLTQQTSCMSSSFHLEQSTWMFKKYPIAYEVASDVVSGNRDVVPILLLNGFGVGSFHQHRLMKQLLSQHQSSDANTQYKIYGIDYLGQGKSWPASCDDGMSEDEYNLGYSADMWIDQLTSFIQQVIAPSTGQKVHIVGNSVGGYLGTILSYKHPELDETLTLLNATPVWGLNLPMWDGKLPAPPLPRFVGRALFDTIRNLDVIDQYLDIAYVYKQAFDGTFDDTFHDEQSDQETKSNALNLKIRGCTEGKGGHAAFASILWSSPASTTDENGNIQTIGFYDGLQQLPIDILLLFGSNDEWCTPAVAKRMHTTLSKRTANSDGYTPCQRYVTIDNAGHCPNHEAPTAVARALESWLEASDRSNASLITGEKESIHEPWGEVMLREVSIEESENLSFVDKIVSSMVG
ncbi:hypothetical protein ACHAXN_001741 [Cyclotella atomus]